MESYFGDQISLDVTGRNAAQREEKFIESFRL
jgi:hypothetical protein